MPSREEALALLREYTQGEPLIKHALAVAAAMRGYARHFGADEEKWEVVGLLHDLDYERYPSLEEHPFRGAEILRERGWPEEIVRAVLSHGDHTGVSRESLMEKTLYAVDELAGFVVAVALVRPNRSLAEVDVAAVRKKMKQKAFAAAVDREAIVNGAQALGVDLDEHIGRVIASLQSAAGELGL